MYVYVYMYVYLCIGKYKCKCKCKCKCKRICICIDICMYIYIYIYIYVYMHICLHVVLKAFGGVLEACFSCVGRCLWVFGRRRSGKTCVAQINIMASQG